MVRFWLIIIKIDFHGVFPSIVTPVSYPHLLYWVKTGSSATAQYEWNEFQFYCWAPPVTILHNTPHWAQGVLFIVSLTYMYDHSWLGQEVQAMGTSPTLMSEDAQTFISPFLPVVSSANCCQRQVSPLHHSWYHYHFSPLAAAFLSKQNTSLTNLLPASAIPQQAAYYPGFCIPTVWFPPSIVTRQLLQVEHFLQPDGVPPRPPRLVPVGRHCPTLCWPNSTAAMPGSLSFQRLIGQPLS